MMSPEKVNEYRIFPRLILVFMAAVFTYITYYFFGTVPLSEHSQWTLASYGVIAAPFVAFFNKYMSTGSKNNDDT